MHPHFTLTFPSFDFTTLTHPTLPFPSPTFYQRDNSHLNFPDIVLFGFGPAESMAPKRLEEYKPEGNRDLGWPRRSEKEPLC
jgi:hypothetical protein